MLYPLDPTDSGAVRAHKEVEVRGRGDRAAFIVDEADGSGKVLAARSSQPFRFEEFARNGHWDYGALASQDSSSDAEAALLALVEKMAAGPYDYDLATYTVAPHQAMRRLGGWGGGWGGWGGWGWPGYGCRRCGGFYGPYFGPGIGFGTTIFIGGRRRW